MAGTIGLSHVTNYVCNNKLHSTKTPCTQISATLQFTQNTFTFPITHEKIKIIDKTLTHIASMRY